MPYDQKYELIIWFKTDEGKRARKNSNKKRKINGYDRNTNKKHGGGEDGNWKNTFKKDIKSPQGLKPVMSDIYEEDKINSSLVAALKASAEFTSKDAAAATVGSIAAAMPSTNLKLQSILKDLTFK